MIEIAVRSCLKDFMTIAISNCRETNKDVKTVSLWHRIHSCIVMTGVFVVMIDKLLTAQWEVHNGRHHGRPFAGSAYIGGGGQNFYGLA